MSDEKKALTDAERQAKRREKAARDGLKACSIGLVRVEHIDAFKAAGALSREGKLILDNGKVFSSKEVECVVEKRVSVIKPVIDLSPLVTSRWPLAIAVGSGFLLGAFLVFLLN